MQVGSNGPALVVSTTRSKTLPFLQCVIRQRKWGTLGLAGLSFTASTTFFNPGVSLSGVCQPTGQGRECPSAGVWDNNRASLSLVHRNIEVNPRPLAAWWNGQGFNDTESYADSLAACTQLPSPKASSMAECHTPRIDSMHRKTGNRMGMPVSHVATKYPTTPTPPKMRTLARIIASMLLSCFLNPFQIVLRLSGFMKKKSGNPRSV